MEAQCYLMLSSPIGCKLAIQVKFGPLQNLKKKAEAIEVLGN